MKDKLGWIQVRKPIRVLLQMKEGLPLADKDLRKVCEDLLHDKYYIAARYPALPLKGDNIWELNPLNDRTWCFWLHTLIVIELLIYGYEKFKESRFLKKACAILWDWQKHNEKKQLPGMEWHDHATALRLIVICKLFETWKATAWDKKTVKNFSRLAEAHCVKLAAPGFYREKHNHGMDQDIALYTASTVFEHLPSAAAWRELALQRFQKQVDHLFSFDGSYMEHSPGYGALFVNRLYHFMMFLHSVGDPESPSLESIIEKQLHYLTNIVQPDGKIPPIGDSQMLPLKMGKWAGLDETVLKHLQYVTSGGAKGVAPPSTEAIFPGGGFAVMRNKWPLDNETVQLVFYSGFHSRVHKHHDDLSFALFAHGQPLLVDSGIYKYDYQSAERNYVVSNRAHNTIVVDSKDTELVRLNIGKSGLTDYYFDQSFSVVAGAHCLYPGIIHQRIVVYDKPWDCLILDFVKGHKQHRFEQVFNFHPLVQCSSTNNTIYGALHQKRCIAVSPLAHQETIEAKLIRGNQEPLQGWCSLTHGNLEPSSSASYVLYGTKAYFATHINLQPWQKSLFGFSSQDDSIEITRRDWKMKIILGNNRLYLLKNDVLVEMNHIPQPTLESAIEDWKHFKYREKYKSERDRRLRLQEELEKKKGGERRE